MSGERVGFRFKHADAVVKRNPQGRSRRGWVMEPVEQTTSRGTKMPAYRIRWRDSERPEIVLQHMLIADPDPTPPPENVSLEPPAPKPDLISFVAFSHELLQFLLGCESCPILFKGGAISC